MRVLVVTHVYPEDVASSVSGSFQRLRMWLDAIQSARAELEILFLPGHGADTSPEQAARVARRLAEVWGVRCEVTLCARDPDPEARDPLSGYVRPMLRMSWNSHFRGYGGRCQREAFAACMARSPDAVLFYYLAGSAVMSARRAGPRVLLDLPDIEHRRIMREVTQPPRRPLKPFRYLWVPALWWGERAAIARASETLVCSRADQAYVRRAMGARDVRVIPNAVARAADRALGAEPVVLYVGTYGYPPNRVAAEHLVRDVWPRLSQLRPEARLLIAGPRPEELPSFRNPPAGVEFLGFVPDLDALYGRARVLCCAIQSGSGTRIKILEAASHGIPVVSTPIGAEGIELEPEREILLRRTAGELAAACAELLADRERAERIGALGRERVRAIYSREAVVALMRESLTGAGAASSRP